MISLSSAKMKQNKGFPLFKLLTYTIYVLTDREQWP